MAVNNKFLTPQVVALEAINILRSNTVMASLVYTDYASEFTSAKRGDTITIRKPANFEAEDFNGSVNVQNAREESVSLTLEHHLDVTCAVTSKEWTLELDDFAGRIIQPAMVALNEKVDRVLCGLYSQFYQTCGVAGTPPASIQDLAKLDQAMNEARIPVAGRRVVVSPATKTALFGIDAVARADARGDEGTALREASMGRIMGMDWFMDQNVARHESGDAASCQTLKINGAVDAGADVIAINGGSGSEKIVAGDVLTVAGVDGSFVVLEDATAASGAFSGVKISPKAPEGGLPDKAAVTFMESHYGNMAFSRDAVALAAVPLELPRGADGRAAHVSHEGLAIRVVYGYDINSKTDTISFDMLLGAKVIDPRLGVRFLG